ncbi:MAG: prephenate dehydrogenase/arogenate dehydrogenase family protein [Gammaproteobacteria bacterium]|nr:prephenate dehydrogenase/arogenate dehydrogenase family protein [Gammaproteobacteria bacterium]
MSADFHIRRLCIIGVGLIGGSLARALRKAGCVDTIIGSSRDHQHLQRAQALGVIDDYHTDMRQAATHADVIVLAVPMGAMGKVMAAIKPAITATTVITDVGSAKQGVITQMLTVMETLPAGFVPAHPIAGTEKSGVEASFAELFEQRRVIITPHAHTDPRASAIITNMWQHCGAKVTTMDAKHHDEVLAATSHLPHMLAYALVDTLARMNDRREIFAYAAGGFRDFTRIASSDPQMWHDICLTNREALTQILNIYITDLQQLRAAIERNDGEYLKATFNRAKAARDQYGE